MTTELDRPVTQNQLTVDGPGAQESSNPASGRKRAPRAPYVPIAYTCGGCDNTWSGVNRAHCGGCHRTWSGPSMFDQHRRLIKDVGICVDPATIKGQVFKGGIWRSDKERTPETWGGAE